MNIFLLAILFSTVAFTKIYLFFVFIYYKKYGLLPSYLLNLLYNSVYYYSKIQLRLMKTQNNVTLYVKSVPFLNNLLTFINSDTYTYTTINHKLSICNSSRKPYG